MNRNPVAPDKPFVYAFNTPRLVLLVCIILALITFSLMLGIRIERYQQTSSVAGYETLRDLSPKIVPEPMTEPAGMKQDTVISTPLKPAPLEPKDSAKKGPAVQPASAEAVIEKTPSKTETKPAAPVEVSTPKTVVETPKQAATKEPEKPPAKIKTSAGMHYAVQISSSQNKTKSVAMVDLLKTKGFDAYVEQIDLGAKGLFYRIMVGPFETEKEAKKVQTQLSADSKFSGAYIRHLP
jgi:cell division septation protein DedD